MSERTGKRQIRPAIFGPDGVQAKAALYFVDDQVLFHGVTDDGVEQIKFLSSATLREAFAKEPIDSGWLPPGVNRCGTSAKGTWMVRWHDPAVYTVRLDGRKTPIRVPMPALIWFGQKNNYYIFAAREKAFSPKATLYHAPLANVSRIGLICFGKNQHPDVARGGFDVAWRTFWDAPFNDHHDDGKSKKHPATVNDHLRAIARQRARVYPVADMVSMGTTLTDAITRLTRRGTDQWD